MCMEDLNIDYWKKWVNLKAEDNDFTILKSDYDLYVAQGGSVVGGGVLSLDALQEKLNNLVKKRARLFHVVQQCEFMTSNILKQTLESKKSIEKFAYIIHDKDYDYEKNEPKKAHFHIIIATKQSTPLPVLSIANWLKVPFHLVEIPKGKNAFVQNVQYLTHESDAQQKLKKHLYGDDEVIANFDFRKLIEDYKLNKDDKLDWRSKVYNGLDLSEVPENIYLKDRTELNNLRREYIRTRAPIPFLRTNIFIEGLSGVGKTIAAREYANSLCGWTLTPQNYDKNVFEVGGKGVLLQGYSGQKIIIWDDIRSFDLVNGLGGMSGFLTTFDPIPSRSEQNIKYGSIRLVNTHNIITGKETFDEFRDNLLNFEVARDKEADKQIVRRFPIIASINKVNYDIRWNKQFFDPFEKDYKQYYQIRNVGLNLEMQKIASLDDKEIKAKHFKHLSNKLSEAETVYKKTENVENVEIFDMQQLLLDFEKDKEVIDYENYNNSNLKKW